MICAGPSDRSTWGQHFPEGVRRAFETSRIEKKKLNVLRFGSEVNRYVQEHEGRQFMQMSMSKADDFLLYTG